MEGDINSIIPGGLPPLSPAKGKTAGARESRPAFEKSFQKELARGCGLKFSAHAEKRLQERNIVLAREDLAKIVQAVSRAEAKGARESLIVYGDLALIASVKNKTVVTALDGKSSENHVFTNIDSAVIVK